MLLPRREPSIPTRKMSRESCLTEAQALCVGKAVFPSPLEKHSCDLGTRSLDAKEILAQLDFMSALL